MRLISCNRTLFLFLLLMQYAICVAGNAVGAASDYFLSFLLPVFDCFLISVAAGLLGKVRLGLLVSLPAVAVSFAELFTVLFYHSHFTTYVVVLMMETNSQESTEFVKTALGHRSAWLAVVLTAAVAALAGGIARWSRKPFRLKRGLCYVLAALIAWSGIRQASAYMKLVRCFGYQTTSACNDPRNIPHQNTSYMRLLYGVAYNMAASAELDVLERSVAEAQVDSCSYRCPLIVLIVGESYNKHHSQLYGYRLPTTPRLEKQRQKQRLVVYTDAVSPFNFTSNCFKNMFSTMDDEDADDWTRHALFPALFKKAGYDVDFLTNQFALGATSNWDYTGGTIFNHRGLSDLQFTRRNTSMYPYDGELISEIPPADSLTARPTLLIVHLIGQHVSYDTRYPDRFAHFKPSDENTAYGGDLGREIAAHYDNATYYNDFVVDSVFNLLCQSDAIAVYLSDHGEEVYDWRSQYERTNESTLSPEVARYQYEIPFMFFMTDTFQLHHPEIAETVRTSADRRFFSSDLPHLLLYLGGISTPEYKEKRNILSPRYDVNRKRIIRNDIDYDQLMKSL